MEIKKDSAGKTSLRQAGAAGSGDGKLHGPVTKAVAPGHNQPQVIMMRAIQIPRAWITSRMMLLGTSKRK